MRHLSLIVLILAASALFAQSNYEIMLNRPDITGLTGGGATNLDGIPTTGLATGTMVTVYDGAETLIYRLTAWTVEVETPPTIIQPDDFADPGNAKVWKARISSNPGETGHGGDNLGNHTSNKLNRKWNSNRICHEQGKYNRSMETPSSRHLRTPRNFHLVRIRN